jgi:uncharacterized SAM-binding protein YcdF (DUF218 family)
MAPARSRVFLYLSLGFTGLCVLVYLVYPFLLRSVGAYLVVEDALQPASAILVLNGESPLRALEAAKIYKEGWAPKVILNQSLRRANFYAYESLDIEVMEQHEYNRAVLLRSGVPDEAITVIMEQTSNTIAELRAALRFLTPSTITSLIIVTSNYHTRRTARIWRYLTEAEIKGIVRWTRSDTSFDPAIWWTSRVSIRRLVNEYLGFISYSLGFPLGIAFPESVRTFIPLFETEIK